MRRTGSALRGAALAAVRANVSHPSAEPFSASVALVVKEVVESIVLRAAYPGTELRLQLQVLRDDGALTACCVTAACAALLDAGIQMSALASSISCVLDGRGRLLVDPTAAEESAARAVLSLGFTSTDPGIQLCIISGPHRMHPPPPFTPLLAAHPPPQAR